MGKYKYKFFNKLIERIFGDAAERIIRDKNYKRRWNWMLYHPAVRTTSAERRFGSSGI